MHTRSKDPHGAGFREVSIVEEFTVESNTTEDSILALFTSKNPQWPAFLIARQTDLPHQTVDNALRRMVQKGMLSKVSGVIRYEGRRRQVKLYSKI